MSDMKFQLPKERQGYRAYIDALYEAGQYLDKDAFLEGVELVGSAMRQDVIDAPDTITVTGKTYYFSNNGSDDNDGLSPQTAWATMDKLNAISDQLQPGDAVLFERGSIWRKPISSLCPANNQPGEYLPTYLFLGQQGVSYGAYGKGRKPMFKGSPLNFADPALWKETDVENVYVCTYKFSNAGVIALDHCGEYGLYDERIAFKEMIDRHDFTGCTDFRRDESYYNDNDTTALYFYSLHGNPGDRYQSMEIGGRYSIIRNANAALYENLEFCYDGYGITGGPSMNVRGCVFYWLGGCQLQAITCKTVVCGNAVEIYGAVDGLYVENCWMYQLCDTGVSHQLWKSEGECVQKNIRFAGNVIEYCHWSIEFNNPPSTDGTTRYIENYDHSYNYLTMGGYGWGSVMFDRPDGATLYNCFGTADTVNGRCEKNVFYRSAGCVYRMRFDGDKKIAYKHKIHLQHKANKIGYLFDGDYPYTDAGKDLLLQRTNQKDPLFFTL